MSYDFAVLVPDLVRSRDQVQSLYEAMCATADRPAPRPVVELVDEVNEAFGVAVDRDRGFLTVDSSADARGTVVCTSWQTVPHNTRVMLELTRDRGFLLYDPQCGRLYDPRNHVRLETSLGGQVAVPYVSEALIAEYLAQPEPDDPFLIIDRDDVHYIQAYVGPDGQIGVEYRDGGPDRHYAATSDDVRLVRSLLWQWTLGTPGWQTAVEWERLRF